MNIAFDPWIPVVTSSGKPTSVSLCTVLTEGAKFADLAVRAHERVSLMRLFLCVVHAALDGPEDYDAWCEVPRKMPLAVKDYLTRWEDCFELFHPQKPWLQVAELNPFLSGDQNATQEKGWTTLNKLCFTRASGNNTTLFDQSSNGKSLTEYTPAEISLNLLTFQNFFVAGGKASSRLWGQWEMRNPPNPKGGPCSGKSILFTLLRGQDLADTIRLNLNTYAELGFLYGNPNFSQGRPIWEMPISSPVDNESILNATQTHIGRLVPLTRLLRVNVDCKRLLLGAGITYPKFQDEKNRFEPDAFATIVLNSDGERELLTVREKNTIWRKLHSLVVRKKNSEDLSRGPLCLMNIPDSNTYDIVVNAMVTNPKRAAEIIDIIESVFHICASLRTSQGTTAYQEEVKIAEYRANRLGCAIEGYRKEIDGAWDELLERAGPLKSELRAKLHSKAYTHYWTVVENNLPLLMDHIEAIGTEAAIPTRDAWRKMLFSVACEAYRATCGQETPRQLRAFAKGFQKLVNAGNDAGPNIRELKEEEE